LLEDPGVVYGQSLMPSKTIKANYIHLYSSAIMIAKKETINDNN